MLRPDQRSLHRGDRRLCRGASRKLHKAAPFPGGNFRVEDLSQVAERGAELRVSRVGEVADEDGGEVRVGRGGVAAAAAAAVLVSSVHAAAAAVAARAAAAAAEATELAAAAASGTSAESAKPAVASSLAASSGTSSSHHHLAALLGRGRGDADRPVAQRVALHTSQGRVALAAVAEANEAVASRAARGRVGDDFRGAHRGEEGAEGLLEREVGDLRREVADKDGVVGCFLTFRFD